VDGVHDVKIITPNFALFNFSCMAYDPTSCILLAGYWGCYVVWEIGGPVKIKDNGKI